MITSRSGAKAAAGTRVILKETNSGRSSDIICAPRVRPEACDTNAAPWALRASLGGHMAAGGSPARALACEPYATMDSFTTDQQLELVGTPLFRAVMCAKFLLFSSKGRTVRSIWYDAVELSEGRMR